MINKNERRLVVNKNIISKVKEFMVVIFLCCIITCVINSDKAGASVNEEYKTACEEALSIIQPMNKEKLEVQIGDIYNVVNTEGELDGYSLGYFVGDMPYGYAIYCIDSSSVREFVFYPEVENLYKELKDKAEECDEVDEDELINGIVYEGGLDYATFDEEGNRVGNFDENLDYCVDDCNEVEYNVDVILNSRPVGKSESNTGVTEFYLEPADSNIYEILQEDAGEYYCIPDFGLAMITSSYINKYSPERGYTCDVVSATGCLNYLGYLYNNSIIDTYNMIFDNCIPDKTKWGKNPGTNTHDFLQEYLSSQNSNIKLTPEFNPSFDRFKYAFTCTNKEPTPVRIIGGNHSVLGLSCYEVNKSRYVGIWTNWGLNEIDPNSGNADFSGLHTDYSLMSLRYFNYDERSTWKDKNLWCDFFENAQSRNIKELHTEYISGNQMVLKCYVPYGTTSVSFPTWTQANGQDDLIWHTGTVKYGTVAECTIDLSTHNKESGTYITDVYSCDKNGTYSSVSRICNTVNTSITNVKVRKNGMAGYTVSCDLPTGTEYVRFPTWSDYNGQDDLIWYDGTVSGGKGNISIDVSNHGNAGGSYITHIYAYDKYNNLISNTGTSLSITNRAAITNAKVSNVTSTGYTISFYAPTGAATMLLPTWTFADGQDDIQWYVISVTNSNGYVSKRILTSAHNSEKGLYITDLYAFDSKGQQIGEYSRLTAEIK